MTHKAPVRRPPVVYLKVPFRAMGGHNEVQIYAPTSAVARRACRAVVAEVQRLEAKYSRYLNDSVLSRINASAGGAGLAVDSETASLIRYADDCYHMSDGLFDVTSGVLRKAWDFSASSAQVRPPEPHVLQPLLARVGWERVRWDLAWLQLPLGMALDFGGIAKEYAADRACAVLRNHGIAHALVNLAGDIRVLGPIPALGAVWHDGRATESLPWRIGVRHPRIANQTLCTLAITEGALATSGDYERFIDVDGQRYCHILNPKTGMPVAYWQSVSVLAPLCVAAGSASTIGMLLGANAGDFLDGQGLAYCTARDHGDGQSVLATGGSLQLGLP